MKTLPLKMMREIPCVFVTSMIGNIGQHGDKAVAQIKAAFEEFKSHENYVVISDDGSRNPIFSKETHLRLSVAKNYQDLLEAIQNLGPVKPTTAKLLKNTARWLMCQEIYSAECLMSSCVPTLNPKVALAFI